jgi:hypothetical protein
VATLARDRSLTSSSRGMSSERPTGRWPVRWARAGLAPLQLPRTRRQGPNQVTQSVIPAVGDALQQRQHERLVERLVQPSWAAAGSPEPLLARAQFDLLLGAVTTRCSGPAL